MMQRGRMPSLCECRISCFSTDFTLLLPRGSCLILRFFCQLLLFCCGHVPQLNITVAQSYVCVSLVTCIVAWSCVFQVCMCAFSLWLRCARLHANGKGRSFVLVILLFSKQYLHVRITPRCAMDRAVCGTALHAGHCCCIHSVDCVAAGILSSTGELVPDLLNWTPDAIH